MKTQPENLNPIPDTPFEAAITRALEQTAAPVVPIHFAARVRAALPAQPLLRAPRKYARIYSGIAIAALLVTICALSPLTRPNFTNIFFDLELILLIELAGIIAWLTTRQSY